VLDEPRRRTQIRRYGQDEAVVDISDLESTSDSDNAENTNNVGDRTRSRGGKKGHSGKSKRGRRSNLDDDFECNDGIVEYGRWSRSECYKVEKGLLTFG